MPYELSEQKKIGLGLIGFGIFFTFLAVLLFFDRGLLALGNIFWLTGVAILLGWRSTLQLFTDRRNYKGSVPFLVGIFFIFVRWPVVGILVEIYGCIVLFGGFWPSIKAFLYQIPVFGWILQYPILHFGNFVFYYFSGRLWLVTTANRYLNGSLLISLGRARVDHGYGVPECDQSYGSEAVNHGSSI